jgi:hypothetical protein
MKQYLPIALTIARIAGTIQARLEARKQAKTEAAARLREKALRDQLEWADDFHEHERYRLKGRWNYKELQQ